VDRISGMPIPPTVAREAVHWLLALSEGNAAQAQQAHAQWQTWLSADPVHAQAWQRIAEVDGTLRGVSSTVALQTLAAPGLRRRHAVHLALWLTVGAGGLLAARQTGVGAQAWQMLAADLSTATGERRETVLSDGTRLLLNTASAVDLRYSASERLIVLRAGEILVQSGRDGASMARPLRVRSAEGLIQAVGTRFTVRQHAGHTAVTVLEGAVELTPEQGRDTRLRLEAGEQGVFRAQATQVAEPLREGSSAWSEGMLVADDMRLSDFVTELARYRSGMLRCAPETAALRVSGAYPLADTDRVLAALTLSLPVQIHRRTRWWVTVAARD